MNALTILLLVLAVTATAALTVPALRRPLLTRHLLAGFRKVVPRMSDTERKALQAGGVWWDAETFSGRPRWQRHLLGAKQSVGPGLPGHPDCDHGRRGEHTDPQL